MPQLWELAPDYATHAETMRVLSTHVLARTRFAATGKFGLRPTAGGLGTGMFGDDFRQVRFSGATLIDETAGAAGAATRALPVDGRTLAELAEFVGVDLDPSFSVGTDTPDLPAADWVVQLDDDAARQVGNWYGFSDLVLVRLLNALPGTTPTGLQIWPEHFDLGTDLDAAPGAERMNVGGSPGDGYLPEPYLYVGPRSANRPGDPGYWNAPFGAALTFTELRATDRPAERALEFLLRGAELLANG